MSGRVHVGPEHSAAGLPKCPPKPLAWTDKANARTKLVVMLVLTQLSAGALIVDQFLGRVLEPELVAALRPLQAGSALVLGVLALGAATLHLGRPQYAYRAVLGLRTAVLPPLRDVDTIADARAVAADAPATRFAATLASIEGAA